MQERINLKVKKGEKKLQLWKKVPQYIYHEKKKKFQEVIVQLSCFVKRIDVWTMPKKKKIFFALGELENEEK